MATIPRKGKTEEKKEPGLEIAYVVSAHIPMTRSDYVPFPATRPPIKEETRNVTFLRAQEEKEMVW